MSAGGSFNPSGGPIDNQQRLQTSPNPSLPPADYSMGYARNFQPPSFFNPFSGYYGANTGMGGFQSQFGGFQQPQFGGFGGFQQPQFGGFGGFGGGFQQPQYGGFQQPQYGGFQQDGFGGQFNRFTRRGQEYTQPYMPQPQPPQMPPDFGGGFGLRQGVMPPPMPYDPRSQVPTILPQRLPDDIQFLPQPPGGLQQPIGSPEPQPVSGVPIGTSRTFSGPNALIDGFKAMDADREAYRIARERQLTPIEPRPLRMAPDFGGGFGGMGNFGGFNPMMGGGIGAFGDRGFMGYR